MAITVKNNLTQVLHTTGMRGGEQVTLIIPPGASATCDAVTPLLETHAKSRTVTVSEAPALPAARPPSEPTPATIVAPPSDPDSSSPTTTSGGKGNRRS